MSDEKDRLRQLLRSKFRTHADTNNCLHAAISLSMEAIDEFISESEQGEPGEIKIGHTVALRWDIDENSETHKGCGFEPGMEREAHTIVGVVEEIGSDILGKSAVLIRQNKDGNTWWYHTSDLYVVDE